MRFNERKLIDFICESRKPKNERTSAYYDYANFLDEHIEQSNKVFASVTMTATADQIQTMPRLPSRSPVDQRTSVGVDTGSQIRRNTYKGVSTRPYGPVQLVPIPTKPVWQRREMQTPSLCACEWCEVWTETLEINGKVSKRYDWSGVWRETKAETLETSDEGIEFSKWCEWRDESSRLKPYLAAGERTDVSVTNAIETYVDSPVVRVYKFDDKGDGLTETATVNGVLTTRLKRCKDPRCKSEPRKDCQFCKAVLREYKERGRHAIDIREKNQNQLAMQAEEDRERIASGDAIVIPAPEGYTLQHEDEEIVLTPVDDNEEADNEFDTDTEADTETQQENEEENEDVLSKRDAVTAAAVKFKKPAKSANEKRTQKEIKAAKMEWQAAKDAAYTEVRKLEILLQHPDLDIATRLQLDAERVEAHKLWTDVLVETAESVSTGIEARARASIYVKALEASLPTCRKIDEQHVGGFAAACNDMHREFEVERERYAMLFMEYAHEQKRDEDARADLVAYVWSQSPVVSDVRYESGELHEVHSRLFPDAAPSLVPRTVEVSNLPAKVSLSRYKSDKTYDMNRPQRDEYLEVYLGSNWPFSWVSESDKDAVAAELEQYTNVTRRKDKKERKEPANRSTMLTDADGEDLGVDYTISKVKTAKMTNNTARGKSTGKTNARPIQSDEDRDKETCAAYDDLEALVELCGLQLVKHGCSKRTQRRSVLKAEKMLRGKWDVLRIVRDYRLGLITADGARARIDALETVAS